MFPIRWNKAFRKKDGSITTIGAEIDAGGGGGGGGSFTPDYENERLIIGVHDNYNYFIPMEKEYVGPGSFGYEIETDTTGSSDASISVYQVIYESGVETEKYLLKHLVYNGDNSYEDNNIKITYNKIAGSSWSIEFSNTMYKLNGDAWTSPITWLYNVSVDNLLFTSDPT